MKAIACKKVTKSFLQNDESDKRISLLKKKNKIAAIKDVTFEVNKGEIFGVLGQNGSGKSTLIRLLSTLLIPDEGDIKIFDQDIIRDRFEIRKKINRVSVEASFFKKLSAMENLSYSLRLYNYNMVAGRKKVEEVLGRLGLKKEKVYCPLEDLSRGMQQKVAIARALLTSPVLILLDEPTTGLDPKSKKEVQDFVMEVKNTHDSTIILTTHDMQEAEKMCTRIAIIDEGRLIAIDTPDNLKKMVAKGDEEVTMEDVFFELTGKGFKEEDGEDADN
ncbi:MAG: ABC transporter ATP-binding protein [Caulobacteraceae bacterium]